MTSPIIIQGSWFATDSSKASAARLEVRNPAATLAKILLNSGEEINVKIESISDRVGSIDRRIEMLDGHVFLTADNDGTDRLAGASSGFLSKVHGLEIFHPRLFVFLSVAVGLIVATIVYGLPVAVKVAVWATPPKIVSWMDASALATLDKLIFNDSKYATEKHSAIQDRFADLVEASQYKGRLKLMFRDGGHIGLNALALPGGTIVLTDQLATLLGTNDEILAVLAHEIAHVQHEHSLQQFYRALSFAGIIGLIAGDLGAVAEEVLSGGGFLIAMAASRKMELEADEKAVALLHKVDIDPQNLSSTLDKLYEAVCKGNVKECEESSWLSSHPGGEQRRDALKGHIEEIYPSLNEEDKKRLDGTSSAPPEPTNTPVNPAVQAPSPEPPPPQPEPEKAAEIADKEGLSPPQNALNPKMRNLVEVYYKYNLDDIEEIYPSLNEEDKKRLDSPSPTPPEPTNTPVNPAVQAPSPEPSPQQPEPEKAAKTDDKKGLPPPRNALNPKLRNLAEVYYKYNKKGFSDDGISVDDLIQQIESAPTEDQITGFSLMLDHLQKNEFPTIPIEEVRQGFGLTEFIEANTKQPEPDMGVATNLLGGGGGVADTLKSFGAGFARVVSTVFDELGADDIAKDIRTFANEWDVARK